jgi:hypothetical protein
MHFFKKQFDLLKKTKKFLWKKRIRMKQAHKLHKNMCCTTLSTPARIKDKKDKKDTEDKRHIRQRRDVKKKMSRTKRATKTKQTKERIHPQPKRKT